MASLITRARVYADRIHAKQRRKYTGEPYFVHLEETAKLCAGVGASKQVVAAAYLHDSIEDQGETVENLARLFGPVVARLVDEVTDRSMFLPEPRPVRSARKALDREWLARASGDGKTIKLADLISNTHSICARDPDFAVTYMREKRLLMPHLIEGNPDLYRRALALLEEYESKHA